MNAAKDASELVNQLRSRHFHSQRTSDPAPAAQGGAAANGGAGQQARPGATSDAEAKALAKAKGYKNYGLDLTRGKVHDTLKAGVLEPTISKIKQLKSAVEACIAIMRIDTLIKLDPEQRGGGEDDGHGH